MRLLLLTCPACVTNVPAVMMWVPGVCITAPVASSVMVPRVASAEIGALRVRSAGTAYVDPITDNVTAETVPAA